MSIVKRLKRYFYTEDLDMLNKEEVTVKINLNKKDDFEFELPLDFIEVFKNAEHKESEYSEMVYSVVESKIIFSDLKSFDKIFESVNSKYKQIKSEQIKQKVIVLKVGLMAKNKDNEVCRTSRFGWDKKMPTSIGFDFELGLKIGTVVYQVLGTYDDLLDEEEMWERLSYQIEIDKHDARESKPTHIIIPYTKERAVFLKNFNEELISLIFRLDSFMEGFGNEMFLRLIDNCEAQSLLPNKPKPIEHKDEEIIDAEVS